MNFLNLLLIPLTIIQLNMNENDLKSVYEIKINDISGNPIELNDFKDKYVLFVNVASKCGFTGQYEDLQKLHEEYKSKLVELVFHAISLEDKSLDNLMKYQHFVRSTMA